MGRTQIETMELVTKQNEDHYEKLTKFKGKLNISQNNPKKFTFGNIIDDANAVSEDTEYTFCVFKIAVGKSYCKKLEPGERPENIELKEGYDSVYYENPYD